MKAKGVHKPVAFPLPIGTIKMMHKIATAYSANESSILVQV